ncbi:conserved hypothetical protein [Leishmania mexicana MHOM/GT/2001/U1103]|uniref:Uncharacterized protein n=1 Tax=Leishmania mexicana (strain MHOM/GT/2001/U1103) TaxID=929439 RepID=E9AKU5_LEIMU|nr:conserved hypothetical protein [Leishmania mexicana MHOM/GT/2001/U1103]CBZ23547.1 conserved hypothetical protein [Leishmania mexicana MHOM/GT/2001/U1103]
MGCKCAKTKERRRQEEPPGAPTEDVGQEAVRHAGTSDPDEALVRESVRPSGTASSSHWRGEDGTRPPEQLPEEAVAEPEADNAVTAVGAPDDSTHSRHSRKATTEMSVKSKESDDAPAEADDASKNAGAALQSSPSRTWTPSEQQKPEQEVPKVGSEFEFEEESNNMEKAAGDEWEVELSQPCPLPPSTQQQPEPAPVPPAAVTATLNDAEPTTPVAMESAPQPIPQRESPRSLPDSCNGQNASAAPSSNAPAPRRLSRKPSIASSSSVSVRPVRRPPQRNLVQPSTNNGGSLRALQYVASPAAAAPPRHLAPPRDEYRAAAAVPPSSTPSSASTAVTSIIDKALMPVGKPSEHMTAPHHSADTGRETVASRQHGNGFLHESSAGLRTPYSQLPLRPVSGQWRRGFLSPIPYRRGYTDPNPGAAPQKYRPSTTYMPPPTAYVMGAAGGAPPRLLFDASTLATIEASTTRLAEARTLRLAGAHNGAAAMITGNDRGNGASFSMSRHLAAPSMSVPLASRLPTSSLSDHVYSLAASAAGVSAAASAPPSITAGSSYSRGSQKPRLAMPAPRAQQQHFPASPHAVEQSLEQHTSNGAGMPARAAVSQAARYDDGVDTPSADVLYGAVQEPVVYGQRY